VRRFIAGLGLALLGGCADTGRDAVSVPLYLAGTDVSEPFPAVGGVEITLERADLAFGPLYLCAGYQAGALCETARLEWVDAAVVNAMDAEPRLAGNLTGASGLVLSYMYDLGLSSVLTLDSPLVMPAAESLGAVSLFIEGVATVAETRVPFVARVPIQQGLETEAGVPVVRKSENERFERDVQPGEQGLTVRFDPRPWIRSVDFRHVAAGPTCCQGRVELEPDTQGFLAIRNALVVEERPRFEWLAP
jgi:hypothetical protein